MFLYLSYLLDLSFHLMFCLLWPLIFAQRNEEQKKVIYCRWQTRYYSCSELRENDGTKKLRKKARLGPYVKLYVERTHTRKDFWQLAMFLNPAHRCVLLVTSHLSLLIKTHIHAHTRCEVATCTQRLRTADGSSWIWRRHMWEWTHGDYSPGKNIHPLCHRTQAHQCKQSIHAAIDDCSNLEIIVIVPRRGSRRHVHHVKPSLFRANHMGRSS